MRMDREDPNLEIRVEIPAQPGLDFDVELNLQNGDELHLCAGALWVEWFPCTDPEETQAYFDAVSGLLSGRCRIVEQRRGRRPVRAELQRPVGEAWECIGSWATLSLPWPAKTQTVLRNAAGDHDPSAAGGSP